MDKLVAALADEKMKCAVDDDGRIPAMSMAKWNAVNDGGDGPNVNDDGEWNCVAKVGMESGNGGGAWTNKIPKYRICRLLDFSKLNIQSTAEK